MSFSQEVSAETLLAPLLRKPRRREATSAKPRNKFLRLPLRSAVEMTTVSIDLCSVVRLQVAMFVDHFTATLGIATLDTPAVRLVGFPTIALLS